MELYITGDTHGDFSRFRPESFYEQERLTNEDVILIAGDYIEKIISRNLLYSAENTII